jgi:hypothetical protein
MYINKTIQKNTVQSTQNTVNTSTHINKTPTYTQIHTLKKLVKTTTVQDTHQMKQSQYNQVPSV